MSRIEEPTRGGGAVDVRSVGKLVRAKKVKDQLRDGAGGPSEERRAPKKSKRIIDSLRDGGIAKGTSRRVGK